MYNLSSLSPQQQSTSRSSSSDGLLSIPSGGRSTSKPTYPYPTTPLPSTLATDILPIYPLSTSQKSLSSTDDVHNFFASSSSPTSDCFSDFATQFPFSTQYASRSTSRLSSTCLVSQPPDSESASKKRKFASEPPIGDDEFLNRSAGLQALRPLRRARTIGPTMDFTSIAGALGALEQAHAFRMYRDRSSTISDITPSYLSTTAPLTSSSVTAYTYSTSSQASSQQSITSDRLDGSQASVGFGGHPNSLPPPLGPPPASLERDEQNPFNGRDRGPKTKTGAIRRGDSALKILRAKAFAVRRRGIIKPNTTAKSIICAICLASPFEVPTVASGLQSIEKHLQGKPYGHSKEEDDLLGIIEKVEDTTDHMAVSAFDYLRAHLSLHIKVQSILKRDKNATVARLYSSMPGNARVSRADLNGLLNMGAKIAALLCAGTMHLLPLLACIPNFQYVLATVDVASLWNACELIRAPEYDPTGHTEVLVREKLVPTLTYIAETCRFSVEAYGLASIDDLPAATLDAQRILHSDHILQATCRDVLKLPSSHGADQSTQSSRSHVWDPLSQRDDSRTLTSSPLADKSESAHEETKDTTYDNFDSITSEFFPGSPAWEELFAQLMPFPKEEDTEEDFLSVNIIKLAVQLENLFSIKCPVMSINRSEWTKAQVATCQLDILSGDFTAKTMTDLRLLIKKSPESQHVSNYYEAVRDLPYAHIPRSLLRRGSLKIVTSDKKMACAVVTEMPPRLRDVFSELVGMAASENIFQAVSGEAAEDCFKTCHFQINYSYACDPIHFPPGVHPSKLEPLHSKNNRETINYRQLCIHESNETISNQRFHHLLKTNLKPAILWLCNAFKHIAPEEYRSSEKFVKSLPLGIMPDHYPFSGLVFNVSSRTLAHRDKKDGGMCMVVPFGKWEGGELVLHEIKLIIDLNHCDAVIFHSSALTHFNLPYTGCRNALVFHCDSQLLRWEDNKRKLGDLVSL